MSLPIKDHFTLGEMSERWETPIHNLQYYAEHGLLEMQAWFSEVVVRLLGFKRTEDGELVETQVGIASYKGYAVMDAEELRRIFRAYDMPKIRKFKSTDSQEFMELFDSRDFFPISINDLVISHMQNTILKQTNGSLKDRMVI